MGRTRIKPAAPVENILDLEKIEAADQAARQLGQLQASYEQGRDLVNQLLGQSQAFQAAGNLLRTFGVSKLAIVKENKLYQHLAGSKTPNGSELKGTWAEFCGLLDVSVDKADEDIKNLQAFGEEALEQMQRIGIGYRDLRQFRRLPTDQKTALIEAAKSGDKDAFLELAEDMMAKHTKEKETLTATAEGLRADMEAQTQVLDNTQKKLAEAEIKLRKRIKTEDPDAALIELTKEAQGYATEALGMIRGRVRAGLAALAEHHEEHGGGPVDLIMAGMVGQLESELKALRDQFNLPDASEAFVHPDAEVWSEIRAHLKQREAAAGTEAE